MNLSKQTWLLRIDQYIGIGLLLFVFFLIFSIALTQAIVILLALAFGIKAALSNDSVIRLSSFDIPVISFFTVRILSIFFSVDFYTSVDSFRKLFFMIAIYFIVSNYFDKRNKDQIRNLFRTLIVAAIIVSILGIIKYVFGFEERVTSPTSGYVTLAVFLTAIFSFSLGIGMFHKLFPKKIMLWGGLLLILLCLTFTFSRSQWIAAFMVMVVIGIVKNIKIPILFSLVIILITIFSPPIQKRAATLIDPFSHSSGRLVIWKGAMMIFPERPILGFGVGTFHTIFPIKEQLVDKGAGRWHNDYLQIAMESGIIGLIAFLVLIFLVFKRGVTLYRRYPTENGFPKGALFGILMALLSFLIGGLWSDFISDPITSMLFWFLIGMLAVFWQLANEQKFRSTAD